VAGHKAGANILSSEDVNVDELCDHDWGQG